MDKNRILSKIKKRLDYLKLKRYYYKEFNKGKSYEAFIIDKIFFGILILVILTSAFFYFTKDLAFSIVITVQIFILYLILSIKYLKYKIKINIENINTKIADEYVIEDMIKKPKPEFLDYIKEILDKINIEKLSRINDETLDFIGVYKGKKVGIKCFQYEQSQTVSIKDLREYFTALRLLNIRTGIIITTSRFENEISSYIEKVKEYVEFYKLDKTKIISILKSINCYPSKKEIEKIIIKRIDNRLNELKSKRRISIINGNYTRYILTAIFLILIGRITPFKKLYTFIGLLLLIISLFVWVQNLIILFKPKHFEKNDILS